MKEPEYNERGFLKYVSDLKPSLRNTYRIVKDSMDKCDAEETLKRKGKKTEHKDSLLKKGIITDLNIQINWIHTGRGPGKRGAERRGCYDDEEDKTVDPIHIQAFAHPTNSRSSSTLTKYQMDQIEDALSTLTPPERQCYVMSVGDCLPWSDIANHLGISKSSVQTNIKRAKKKISRDLHQSLFLQEFSWDREKDSDYE